MEEELEKKPAAWQRPKTELEEMSIEVLGRYITEMEAEIVRVREMIGSKQGVRGVAESLFKS